MKHAVHAAEEVGLKLIEEKRLTDLCCADDAALIDDSSSSSSSSSLFVQIIIVEFGHVSPGNMRSSKTLRCEDCHGRKHCHWLQTEEGRGIGSPNVLVTGSTKV